MRESTDPSKTAVVEEPTPVEHVSKPDPPRGTIAEWTITILLLLFLDTLFFGALFDAAVFVPAGEEDPADDERADGECGPGIEKGILEDRFSWRIRLGQHACTPFVQELS